MLWMIPVAVVVGKLLYDVVTDEGPSPSPSQPRPTPTPLSRNFNRLSRELRQPGGRRVAVLGQPGAGKSSLLRRLSNQQMTPLPQVGVHTDATNWAESPDVPLVSHWQGVRFVDVPGYDTASHPVAAYLADFPFNQFDLFVLVLNGKLHEADQRMYRACLQRAATGTPIMLVRSFAESLDEDVDPGVRRRALWDLRHRLDCGQQAPALLASSRTGEGLPDLRLWLGC